MLNTLIKLSQFSRQNIDLRVAPCAAHAGNNHRVIAAHGGEEEGGGRRHHGGVLQDIGHPRAGDHRVVPRAAAREHRDRREAPVRQGPIAPTEDGWSRCRP